MFYNSTIKPFHCLVTTLPLWRQREKNEFRVLHWTFYLRITIIDLGKVQVHTVIVISYGIPSGCEELSGKAFLLIEKNLSAQYIRTGANALGHQH